MNIKICAHTLFIAFLLSGLSLSAKSQIKTGALGSSASCAVLDNNYLEISITPATTNMNFFTYHKLVGGTVFTGPHNNWFNHDNLQPVTLKMPHTAPHDYIVVQSRENGIEREFFSVPCIAPANK